MLIQWNAPEAIQDSFLSSQLHFLRRINTRHDRNSRVNNRGKLRHRLKITERERDIRRVPDDYWKAKATSISRE